MVDRRNGRGSQLRESVIEGPIMPRLGVNIDHVATLRQARGGPRARPGLGGRRRPSWAGPTGSRSTSARTAGTSRTATSACSARRSGPGSTWRLAAEPEIVAIALEVRPDQVTLVPERRAELTTEGGLDVVGQRDRVAEAVARCRDAGLEVSLFIDPDPAQVEASAALGAVAVELHTGRYADADRRRPDRARELAALAAAGAAAVAAGLACTPVTA